MLNLIKFWIFAHHNQEPQGLKSFLIRGKFSLKVLLLHEINSVLKIHLAQQPVGITQKLIYNVRIEVQQWATQQRETRKSIVSSSHKQPSKHETCATCACSLFSQRGSAWIFKYQTTVDKPMNSNGLVTGTVVPNSIRLENTSQRSRISTSFAFAPTEVIRISRQLVFMFILRRSMKQLHYGNRSVLVCAWPGPFPDIQEIAFLLTSKTPARVMSESFIANLLANARRYFHESRRR